MGAHHIGLGMDRRRRAGPDPAGEDTVDHQAPEYLAQLREDAGAIIDAGPHTPAEWLAWFSIDTPSRRWIVQEYFRQRKESDFAEVRAIKATLRACTDADALEVWPRREAIIAALRLGYVGTPVPVPEWWAGQRVLVVDSRRRTYRRALVERVSKDGFIRVRGIWFSADGGKGLYRAAYWHLSLVSDSPSERERLEGVGVKEHGGGNG